MNFYLDFVRGVVSVSSLHRDDGRVVSIKFTI